jgi:predicted RNA polymerase sigma factor
MTSVRFHPYRCFAAADTLPPTLSRTPCFTTRKPVERLAGHYRLDAVRGHLFEMAGNREAAIVHYRTAAGRTTSIRERNYLLTQAARLTVERT